MQVCGTKSVWTVDLAYILSRYGVDFIFYTITDGVRPEYDSEVLIYVADQLWDCPLTINILWVLPQAFYKADIDKDMLRVNRLFQSADSLNIHIQKRCACLCLS